MRFTFLTFLFVSLAFGQNAQKQVLLGTAPSGGHSYSYSFNGTNQAISTSGVVAFAGSAITVAFWIKTSSWGTGDQLCGESSSDFNSNAGAFIIDCGYSGATGNINFQEFCGSGVYSGGYFAQPSTGSWHYIVLVGQTLLPYAAYVDGSAVTITGTTGCAQNFTSQTFYFMSRAAGSLWETGSVAELAIWATALTSGNVTTLYNGGSGAAATSVGSPIRYWHGCDLTTDVIAGASTWTPTGSPSQVTGPGYVNCP